MFDLRSILAAPFFYETLQKPLLEKKLAPLKRDGVIEKTNSVIDIGCGPGINSALFRDKRYLGIDLSKKYIDFANKHRTGDFRVADATSFKTDEKFDLVFMNSLMHHIDDAGTERLLGSCEKFLNEDGEIRILDLVMPEKPCLARLLAKADRGNHVRTAEKWETLFDRHLNRKNVEYYNITFFRIPFFTMIHYTGTK